MAAVVLAGDAGAVAGQLAEEAAAGALAPSRFAAWRDAIAAEVSLPPGAPLLSPHGLPQLCRVLMASLWLPHET